jgi:ABC-type branched-subunit amino acid transport system ATPase component
MKDTHLEAKDIYKYFGGVKALEGATVVVSKNKLFSLIGPNGSGKTTLFNVVTCWLEKTNPYELDVEKGLLSRLLGWLLGKFSRNGEQPEKTSNESLPEDVGSVEFENRRIDGLNAHEAALTGMMRTFQTTRNWPKLTVLENLLVAPPKQTGDSFLNIFFKRKKIKEEERKNTLRALEILEFLEVTHIRDQLGEELSGGQLKILALGRVLMTAPNLILLDEPTAGINPSLANKIMDKILDLKVDSTIFLIEHNMDVVFNYSDEIFVMARGKIIAQGAPQEIETNRDVIEAYLGADY